MKPQPGLSLLHYRMMDKIGEGGMGEVWKALDTTLDREVAVKFIPDQFAGDSERLARFVREAKMLATLNHPNIAAVYGLHEAEGTHFIAMELIPGEDLAERLARGALAVADAIDVARQVADALEAAHEQGVIHRDLKPANIKRTPEGKIKVLDLGLAKALTPEMSSDPSSLSISPTVTSAGTVAGTLMGTAAYMSPEQAKGRAVDRRADIWAFGVVLHEMLTGTKLFDAETVSETLAALLRDEVSIDQLPSDTPASVKHLIGRCLDRDPRSRLRDIGEARIALAADALTAAGPDAAGPNAEASRPGRSLLPWALVTLLAIVAAGLALLTLPALLGLRQPASTPGEAIRFDISLPDGTLLRTMYEAAAPPEVSPDGRHVVFGVMEAGGENRLWLRSLDQPPRPLPGTENGIRPFWSPDSRNIGFFTTSELRRMDITGGPALPLCEVAGARGGTWNADGTIIMARSSATGLVRIPDSGGDPQPVTELRTSPIETSHRYPHFLPDGKHFIYLALGGSGALGAGAESENRLMAGSLDGDEPRLVLQGASNTVYAAGHLVYRRGKALRARPFDPDRLEFTGEERTLAEAVHYDSGYERAVFSASDRLLAYVAGDFIGELSSKLLDRSGQVVREIRGNLMETEPTFSPDGRRLAQRSSDASGEHVWIFDLERDIHSRLTFDDGFQGTPVWSPDGKNVAYTSTTGKAWRTLVRRADGNGEPRELTDESFNVYPVEWSPDGKYLVLGRWTGEEGFDLWLMDLEAESDPRPFLAAPYSETLPAVSPDGRWLAYTSDESGRPEVYLTRFPSAEGKWQVSGDSGLDPVWDVEGKGLFYRTTGQAMMEVPLTLAGSEPRIGSARNLFDVYTSLDVETKAIDLSPDGKWFVASVFPDEHVRAPITVVVDWAQKLRAAE